QIGQRRSSAELVGGIAVAVEERFELLVFAQEHVEHLLRRERGRHRQVTARHSLGQAKKVGLDAFVVAGEQRRAGVWSALEGSFLFSPVFGLSRLTSLRAAWRARRLPYSPKTRHHLVGNQLRA